MNHSYFSAHASSLIHVIAGSSLMVEDRWENDPQMRADMQEFLRSHITFDEFFAGLTEREKLGEHRRRWGALIAAAVKPAHGRFVEYAPQRQMFTDEELSTPISIYAIAVSAIPKVEGALRWQIEVASAVEWVAVRVLDQDLNHRYSMPFNAVNDLFGHLAPHNARPYHKAQ